MMFDKKWPHYAEDEIAAVTRVIRSGKVNYWTGQEGRLFEKEYADYLGVSYAIAVANGTNALELCLHALEMGRGDEVIVPCRTFMASASCVVAVGATPIVCDIDPQTQNLTPATIRPHLTPRTKAIIAVHLGGMPCDMPALMAFAKQHNLYVIEDCAQAHGAMINGKPVGSFGDLAAFSFCQDKIISTLGEGGLVATNQQEWWQKAWAYKDHGKGYDTVYHKAHAPGFRWVHDSFGSNYRMTEAQAAVGRLQLRKLTEWQKVRARYAEILTAALASFPQVTIPRPAPHCVHAYYRYYVLVEPAIRDAVMFDLTHQGIWCQVGICADIQQEKAFIDAYGSQRSFEGAQYLGVRSLALLVDPLYSEVESQQLAFALTTSLQKNRG